MSTDREDEGRINDEVEEMKRCDMVPYGFRLCREKSGGWTWRRVYVSREFLFVKEAYK